MRVNIPAIISRLCALCMGLLGFGCSSLNNEPEDMYGTPTGEWEIKGMVTDEAGKTVPDANIKVALPDEDSNRFSITTVETDDGGNYVVRDKEYGPYSCLKVVCIPEDPNLSSDSTIVKLKYVKDKDSKSNFWFIGKAEATVDFVLKPAEDKD